MSDRQAADCDHAVSAGRETVRGLRTTETAPLPNFEVEDVGTEVISAAEDHEDPPVAREGEALAILALRESHRQEANA